ncbi:MAG: hypothetical protein Q8P62_01705 [Candidatus Peregrinibacteria bacterium]|nr:hypothetical protein [Candidatus Peregrinibacteria bacterium]
MANSSFETGGKLSDYGVESKINAIRYDGNEFMKMASSELMANRGYSLIKGEIFRKVDASREKVTQEKVNEYFDGLGGDDFAKDVFQKGKESLLKDAKEANNDPEAYWKKYAKAYDARKGKNLTAEEDKEDTRITEILVKKGLISLSQLSLKDAIANGIYPKFDAKAATLRGLKIWDTQDKKVRIKALKKSAATSGAVSRRTTLQERVSKYNNPLHKAEYALGSGKMSPEYASTTPKLDTTLEYRATGSASTATWNPDVIRPESEWRGRWQTRAKQYNALYFSGRLYNEFPGAIESSDKVLGAIDAIDRLDIGAKDSSAFNAEEFKTKIDKLFGKDIIYGAHGVLNMLLALERASEEVAKHSGETKILYNLKIGKGKSAKHRFSRLDTKALQKGEVKDAKDQKGVKQVGVEQKESIKVALIDSFEQGFDKIMPDIQGRTGVALSKVAGKLPGGIKFVDCFGTYKAVKNQKLLRVIAWEGGLRMESKQYATVEDALVAAQAIIPKKAEKFQNGQDVQSTMEESDRKLAAKEKWITSFDTFIDTNKNDLIQAGITVVKELNNTFSFGLPDAKKTYDYKITVGSNNIFFVIPEPEEGKMDLWARVVNREVKTTIKSIAKIDVDFKNPKKFIADILAANEKLKEMEKDEEQKPAVESPKAKPAPKSKEETVQRIQEIEKSQKNNDRILTKLKYDADELAKGADTPERKAKMAEVQKRIAEVRNDHGKLNAELIALKQRVVQWEEQPLAPEDKLIQKKDKPAPVTKSPVAPEKPKVFTEAFSAEKPKDMNVAVQQLQEIYNALDKLFPKKGQAEDGVWGSTITPGQATSAFRLTVKGKTYPISVKLSDSNEIEFVIGGKDAYSTRPTQKELAKHIETILK